MFKRIQIDLLQPGMVIVQITAQNGPVRIRKAGLVTSPEMVQGLKEMGVQELEIDTAQTVELETEVSTVPSSPTKTLLMQGAQNSLVDHKLSEQFNRSLFLPSVQSLPGSWRYYGRKVFTAVLVLFGGIGLGYSAAVMPWQQLFTPAQPVVASSAPETTAEPVAETVTPVNQPEASQQPDALSESAASANAINSNQPITEMPQDEQGIPVRAQPQPVATNDISPELLQRFREAVSELDEQPEPANVKAGRPVDVPRVDQLPAWVLAELPSMSFSTHLYASQPSERRVRVNGMELGEGDFIRDNLRIVRIDPQHVILAYKGQEFSLPALGEW
ncbi:general secretion pathway protein GspB [Bowmanella denitrificans]|uniref:general secretion pathway protein GspB n=1 Tax=Bowmanella denitrificans TaxID=366582 RepID=UPI000C9B8069|nr:general secretion pathway protein GspB [Bowmanella denitrificans]